MEQSAYRGLWGECVRHQDCECFGTNSGFWVIWGRKIKNRKQKEHMMKKRTRYQAAVPAWVLIAAMGMSPIFSAVGITGNGVVYGSELVSGTRGVYAGENVGQDGILAGSLLGYSDSGSDREGEWEKESGRSPEWKNLVRIATPSQAEPKTGAGQEGEPDEKEALDGTGERIRGSAVFDSSYKKAAKELESETELRVATASNAVMSLRRASIWGGMGMSDHFDGEGTKENPYQINSAKDLKLLAYNVANEEVDGYEGCYFTLSRDISLSDSASWLPIGYFTELGDSEPKPFKGNFDGQVNARSKAGILAGESNDSTIRNCNVKGQVRGTGVMGGVVGEAYDSAILECVNTAGVLGGIRIPAEARRHLQGESAGRPEVPLSVTAPVIPRTATAPCIRKGM